MTPPISTGSPWKSTTRTTSDWLSPVTVRISYLPACCLGKKGDAGARGPLVKHVRSPGPASRPAHWRA
nr:MAG TPA: hypothetical protein [Caudoviricetes sp.]